MSKFNWAGIACIVMALVLILFQAISTQMGEKKKKQWSKITIEKIVEPKQLAWIDRITWKPGQKAADYLVVTPLYLILFTIGGLCLVVGTFFWKR